MKEHETIYPCLPDGPIQRIDAILMCTLCGTHSPNQDHLKAHNVGSCASKRRQYTRKLNLVKHLESHSAQNCSALADKWRTTLAKRSFSCGFCIALLTTLVEQLNHIDAHFRHYEDIASWSFGKVIRGLLLQPGVSQSWDALTVDYDISAFDWDQSSNGGLQLRLELGVEPVSDLALAAFECSSYDDEVDDAGLVMLPSERLGKLNEQLPAFESHDMTEQTSANANSLTFSPDVLTWAPTSFPQSQTMSLLEDSLDPEGGVGLNLFPFNSHSENHDMTLESSRDRHTDSLLLQSKS